MLNVLSFDVEDWYQVESFRGVVKFEDWDKYESRVVANTFRILNILDNANVRATFFVLGWVAERFPELVKEIDKRGHEIASHGYRHTLVYKQSPEEFKKDLRKSLAILEGITGKKILGYRASGWSITKECMWAMDILEEEGLKYDSSIYPIRLRHGTPESSRFPYKIRENLWEIPLPTMRLLGFNIPFGGGFFLRAVPYFFTKWCIKQVTTHNSQLTTHHSPTVCLYLHPWELDPEQPVIKVSLKRRLIHYFNLRNTEAKLKRLLHDFEFMPVREILKLCNF